MEKKNTILLTVIAIATLLVAVVGATFAYFTAKVTTSNDANNTVNAKTYALTEVEMNYGSKVEGKGIYPGTTLVKDLSISAKCPTGSTTCDPVNTELKITTTDTNKVFGSDVKWTLYKMEANTDEVKCELENKITNGQYYTETTCKVTETDGTEHEDAFDADAGTLTRGTVVKSGTADKTKESVTEKIPIKVYGVTQGDNTKTDDKYYLVVEYLNNDATTTNEDGSVTVNQDAQQGKEFSIEISFDVTA